MFFYKICMHKIFGILSFLLILMNTLVLCEDRYPISDFESNLIDIMNSVFFVWFLIEMIIKMILNLIKIN